MKSVIGVMLIFFHLLAAACSWAGPREEMANRLNKGLNVFPHILAGDRDVTSKTDEQGALRLLFVYRDDREEAEALKKRLEKKKPSVKNIAVVTEIIAGSDMGSAPSRRLGGIFLTQALPEDVFQRVIDFAVANQVIVFSSIIGDVERGATAGIYISMRTRLSLNLTTLDKSKIRIKKRIREISKKYQ